MDSRKQTAAHRGKPKGAGDAPMLSVLFLSVAIGLAVMAASALVLLLIGSGVAYSSQDPAAIAKPLALAALYVSIFLGGFASAKRSGDNKLICGLLFTALAFAVLLLLKLMLSGGGEGMSGSAYYLLGALGASAVGVLASSYTPQRKPMSRKKRAEKFKRK